jgi:sporulation protein YlmC with PRC-barrel domain
VKLFVFLSEIIGQDVVDKNGRLIGRLSDIPLRISDEIYPRAAGLVIERGALRKEYAHIEINQMETINEAWKANVPKHQLTFNKNRPRYDLTLRRDILDQQVVDTDNQKVVRVNDVHLLRVDNQLYLAHVDVGLRALVRRLEWTPFVDAFIKTIFPKSPYLTEEDFIPWKNTHVLRAGRNKNVLQLDVAPALFLILMYNLYIKQPII